MNNQLTPLRNGYFVKLVAVPAFLGALFLLASCNPSPAEQYGFVTLLGADTIAVESITREGDNVTSDGVDRFPRVRVRHTVIDLNPDGSIKHLVMDIHSPGEPADRRDLKVTADVTADKVHLSKTDGTGTLNREFATGGGIVEAHVPQMYSLYELYLAAAVKHAAATKLEAGKPVLMRQFYIDREFDRFPLGRGSVTPRGNGKVEITHDWLSGTGEATLDSTNHMLSYAGNRTTYKVAVSRLASPPYIKSIADRFAATEAKTGRVNQLSVRDTVKAQIGNAMFTVDYGRPLLRGRTLLGDVLPYDRVWRTGANQATQFTTSLPVKLGGMQVLAGTYTLWTVPHTASVDLIVNKQAGQWGTDYNRNLNLGTTTFASQALSTPVEKFTISIIPDKAKHGMLVMEWGSFKWTAPIEVQ
jgi:hypothetical protein